jgi:two-component system, OmpR family, response regulator
MMRILVVEDEIELARLLAGQLRDAGFECDCVGSTKEAKDALREGYYDLLLLDRRLPDGDGLSQIPSFRAIGPNIRIIMLTARDAPNDKARGLDAGADDYIAKPYDREELLARIRARLRNAPGASLPPIQAGALSYDPVSGQISVHGRQLVMHRREFALMEALLRRANQVAVRKNLMQEVYSCDEAVLPGALDTLVSRLRRRLTEENAGVVIHLVRGRGYLLTEEQSCENNRH